MITATLTLKAEAALHATKATVFPTESVSQLILSAEPSMLMELVPAAILKISSTKETVSLFQSWLIFYCTTLSVALRNFKLSKLLKLNQDIDLDFIRFMIIHYYSSLFKYFS